MRLHGIISALSSQLSIVSSVIDLLLDFLHFFISMYISELLVQTPVFGGALYVAGQFWVAFARLYNKRTARYIPEVIRTKGMLLFVVSLILCLALIVIYPYVMTRGSSPLLLLSIALLLTRELVTNYLAVKLRRRRKLSLISAHVAFIATGMLIFSSATTDEYVTVFVCLALLGVPLALKQLFITPKVQPIHPPETLPGLDGVSSYRIYNNALVNMIVAANLSITMYICYLRYLPYSDFLTSFLGLMVWLLFTVAVTALFIRFLYRRTKWRYDKPTLFMVGAACWITATTMVYNGTLALTGYDLYVLGAMYGFGLACMLSIIIAMGVEMKSVVKIGVGKIDNGAYEYNTYIMIEWSMLISWLSVMFLLTLSSFIMDGDATGRLGAQPQFPEIMRWVSFLLPMVCVVGSIVYILIQPLDKHYLEKLHGYYRKLDRGELNQAVEDRLKKVLVASYPKRVGINILKLIARPWVPIKRVEGRERIREADLPVVFVCNHYELYGPIAAVVRMPYYFRPWIIHDFLDKDLISESMKGGVDTVAGWIPLPVRRFLTKFFIPLVLWIIRSLDPIPVYRDSKGGIINTIRMTVETLEYEDNILLFPENPAKEANGKYRLDSISEFFTGFSHIGIKYFQRTGKRLLFVPVYIDKQSQTITFGEGVRFDPKNSKSAEKERITESLLGRMREMAREA